uniref:Uncharacterized protein n=1 Tax=Micrurus surinamensis TaxID=129470 RepID=A0A2D4NZS6_MICSU
MIAFLLLIVQFSDCHGNSYLLPGLHIMLYAMAVHTPRQNRMVLLSALQSVHKLDLCYDEINGIKAKKKDHLCSMTDCFDVLLYFYYTLSFKNDRIYFFPFP